jgi:hypothetical protein
VEADRAGDARGARVGNAGLERSPGDRLKPVPSFRPAS